MAYTDLSANFYYKKPLLTQDLIALAENDAILKISGWQDGIKVFFFNPFAPTGWTRDTTFSNRVIRIVNTTGTGGSSGTTRITLPLTLAHTHTVNTEVDHSHDSSHSHSLKSQGSQQGDYLGGLFEVDSSEIVWKFGSFSTSSGLHNKTDITAPPISSSGVHNHGGLTGSALTNISLAYSLSILCAKDISSGYMDETTAFNSGDDLGIENTYSDLDSLAENDEYLYNRLTPAGSSLLFFNSTAPTGWTKSTTVFDHVAGVSSTVGGITGSGASITTPISLAHSAHTFSASGTHQHNLLAHTHQFDSSIYPADNGTTVTSYRMYLDASNNLRVAPSGGTSSKNFLDGGFNSIAPGFSDSEPNHTHTVSDELEDISLAYIDVILCDKDSLGAPHDYTDLTSFFMDSNLLAYQELNDLGKNDEYIKYHTPEEGSVVIFYESSSPVGWTKLISHHDKYVRIVSTLGGGGSGGSRLVSEGIPLNHAHTIDAHVHTHTFNHQHTATSTNTGNIVTGSEWYVSAPINPFLVPLNPTAASTKQIYGGLTEDTEDNELSENSHAHGGATGSALSDQVLAYVNAILCTKDAL